MTAASSGAELACSRRKLTRGMALALEAESSASKGPLLVAKIVSNTLCFETRLVDVT